jgi:phage terminase small subunit
VTARQKRFVQEYLLDLNASQAAVRAGYSVRTAGEQGYENLKKPEIQMAIKKAVAARNERTELTQDWVIARLLEVVQRSMQAVPVLNRQGKETGEYVFQGSVANRALELLGKHQGMFAEKSKDPRDKETDKTEMTSKEIEKQLAELGYVKKESDVRDRNPDSN